MLNRILSVLAGIVVAFGLVAAIEALGHALFPPPPDLDFADPDAFAAYVASMPGVAIAMVLCAWVIGAFCGSLVGTLLGKPRRPLAAIIVTALVVAGAVVNMTMIPHPLWFMIAAVIAVPLAGVAAWKLLAPAGPAAAG